jgi:ubiquinone/menaquinone biosynthesis C-methylase UbiE
MGAISDSDAVLEKERLFAQHQAALTILQGLIDKPGITSFDWLDIGCGKGQIIINLDDNLGEESRKIISYNGFDIKEDFLLIAIRKAESLSLKASNGQIGDITNFANLHPEENKFDFITITNSIHELDPFQIPIVLLECILRLKDDGILFIYDMEALPFRELGAVAWTREEIHEILKVFLKTIGTDYSPTPGKWKHKSCNGWNIQLKRSHFEIENETINESKTEIIRISQEQVKKTLHTKLEKCMVSLESLTKYGAETEDEENLKLANLFDFWAINRIKENIK